MPGRSLPVVSPPPAQATPPVFERIGIVGLGLIGGSLAMACRAAWPTSLVIGVDANDVLEAAMVRHAVDVGADDLGMLAEAQLVVLAAPVDANVEVLGRLSDYVAGDAIVTDVGGTKRAMVAAARGLPSRLVFVGGHPLAGAARQGIEFASPGIFKDRPWILTPEAATPGDAVDRVERWLAGLGAVPSRMAPDAHDHLMAAVSHVPQLVASALMQLVGERGGDEGLALAGRGLRDTTRLASSPPQVWTGVCATNADEIGSALDAFIATLQALRADLDRGEVLAEVFERARRWRDRLEPH